MPKYLLALICSFVISAILTPLVRKIAMRMKLRQTILSYVENHAGKSGTPTMGGIAFVLSTIITALFFFRGNATLARLLLLIIFGFGTVGFFDDFIKIAFHRNEGLRPWQKIVFQLAVSIIVSVFASNNGLVGDKLYLPFTYKEISIGVFALPFYSLVFVAFSNAVNLTDGLDGLAGGTAVIYTVFFTALLGFASYSLGLSLVERQENVNLIYFCLALIGSLMGFLLYNGFPATIFMGDTGSLALGGALAGLAVLTKTSLIAPLVGVVYLFSCISVIIQVCYYKKTKKRVFLMAPFHHHLERKGMHENKIVALYCGITFFVGATTLFVTIFSL